MRDAPESALERRVQVELKQQDDVDTLSLFGEILLQPIRLRLIAGIAIEDHTVGGVGLAQAIFDHLIGGFIID